MELLPEACVPGRVLHGHGGQYDHSRRARFAGVGQQVESGWTGSTRAEQDGIHAVDGGSLRGMDELGTRGEFGVRVAGDSGDFRSPLDQEADGFPADDAGGPGDQDHD